MTRQSDYVVRRLEEWRVRHVFLVTGGRSMFLNDSIARSERINHHEYDREELSLSLLIPAIETGA